MNFFCKYPRRKSSNFIASNNITVKWRHFRVIIITLWSRSKDPAKAEFMFSLCWGEEYIPTVTFLFAVLKINYFVYFPISAELFLNLNEETWGKKSKLYWPNIQDRSRSDASDDLRISTSHETNSQDYLRKDSSQWLYEFVYQNHCVSFVVFSHKS